jgi:hypothetical protein
MTDRFWLFLLLGSYDEITLKVLIKIKDQISQRLMYENDNVLVLMLDSIDLYSVELRESGKVRKITVIAEKYDNKVALFTLNESLIRDAVDLNLSSSTDVDKLVKDYFAKKYELVNFIKLGILPKLEQLGMAASMVFLIRDQELTRGGEYIELVYLLGARALKGADMYLIKREGLELSEMAWEILTEYGVNYRSYKDETQLFNELTRIVKNHIRKKTDS